MVGVHDIEIQQQKIHSMMTQKRIFFFVSSEKHVAIDLDKTFVMKHSSGVGSAFAIKKCFRPLKSSPNCTNETFMFTTPAN